MCGPLPGTRFARSHSARQHRQRRSARTRGRAGLAGERRPERDVRLHCATGKIVPSRSPKPASWALVGSVQTVLAAASRSRLNKSRGRCCRRPQDSAFCLPRQDSLRRRVMAPLIRLVLACRYSAADASPFKQSLRIARSIWAISREDWSRAPHSGTNNAGQVAGNSAAAQLDPGWLARRLQPSGGLPPAACRTSAPCRDRAISAKLAHQRRRPCRWIECRHRFSSVPWTLVPACRTWALPPGGDFSEAFGINAGQVVGRASAASGDRAFLWTSRGGMQEHRPWQRQWPNNAGQVVGGSDDGRAFLVDSPRRHPGLVPAQPATSTRSARS